MRNYYKKLKKGFTLVELVVVIAVIAILAAVSVGAYFGITDSANSSNATTSLKQVKDYWTMYSVSDYDSSNTLSETGDDFAIRYLIEYNGYTSTYVNYAEFTVDNATSPQQGGVEEKGLIFKVETDYPTYFILKGNRIIEESKTPSKTEEEFFAAIDESSLVKEEASALDFKLSTIIFNDNEVRGHSYIQFDVDTYKGDLKSAEDIVYVKNGKTLLSADSTYKPAKFKIADGTEADVFNIKNNDEGKTDFNIEENVVSESNISTVRISDERYNYRDIKYGYVVENKEILKVYSNHVPSITDYPVVVFNGKYGYYSYYEGFNDPSFKLESNTTGVNNVILIANTSLSKPLSIPSGYDVVVDYLFTQEDIESICSVPESGSARYLNPKGMTGSDSKTNKRFGGDGTLNKVLCSDQFNITNDIATYNKPLTKYLKNTFTIESGVTLTLESGSTLSVEAQVDLANGGSGCGIMHFAKIANEGSIIVKENASLKAIGKITGNGNIVCYNNSTIYDLFKITSFAGGSVLTKFSLSLSTLGGVLDGIFPVNEYIFDNIQCTANFYYGAKYNFLSPVDSNGSYIVEEMEFIGVSNAFFIYDYSQNETIPSTPVLSKKVKNNDDANGKIHLNSLTFHENSKFRFGSLTLNALGFSLHSEDFSFPLAHIEIVNNGNITIGKVNGKSLKVEILPTSRLINNGTFTVKDGATVAACTFTNDHYTQIINGKSGKRTAYKDSTAIMGVYKMFKATFGEVSLSDLVSGVSMNGEYSYKYLWELKWTDSLSYPSVSERCVKVSALNS